MKMTLLGSRKESEVLESYSNHKMSHHENYTQTSLNEPLYSLKEHSTFFLEICSFYNSPRVKQLSFTDFESIQLISGSGRSTFSLA